MANAYVRRMHTYVAWPMQLVCKFLFQNERFLDDEISSFDRLYDKPLPYAIIINLQTSNLPLVAQVPSKSKTRLQRKKSFNTMRFRNFNASIHCCLTSSSYGLLLTIQILNSILSVMKTIPYYGNITVM